MIVRYEYRAGRIWRPTFTFRRWSIILCVPVEYKLWISSSIISTALPNPRRVFKIQRRFVNSETRVSRTLQSSSELSKLRLENSSRKVETPIWFKDSRRYKMMKISYLIRWQTWRKRKKSIESIKISLEVRCNISFDSVPTFHVLT